MAVYLWGQLFKKIRNSVATREDIEIINSQIASKQTLPPSIRYACCFNKDKAAINTATFQQQLSFSRTKYGSTAGYPLTFADNIQIKNVSNLFAPFTNPYM
jgi:hypothetical protein